MRLGRGDAVLAATAGCAAVSVVCLWYFAWGMFYAQDLWRVNVFAGYLVGGLFAAVAGAAAGETLRRKHKDIASGVLGGTLVTGAWLLLVIQLGAFLYCNAGPARTVATAVVRRVVTYGMSRDLPIPPSPSP